MTDSRQPFAAIPKLSAEQRVAASQRASAARRIRAEVKNKLRHGTTSIEEVLTLGRSDPVVGRMRVVELLEAMPRIGKVRASELMDRHHIAATRRIRGLGPHQITALTTQFRP